MLRLARRFSSALLDYALENGLELVYHQALQYLAQPGKKAAPEPLAAFLSTIPDDHAETVIDQFLDIARRRLNFIETEVISATPLTPQQRQNVEIKLIRMFRRQMDITFTVDPSLLGGLRVIANDTVIDDSIKRKLFDKKTSIYKGVQFEE
jgi:F0F1-type ATP synthase delta subunit